MIKRLPYVRGPLPKDSIFVSGRLNTTICKDTIYSRGCVKTWPFGKINMAACKDLFSKPPALASHLYYLVHTFQF
jgi:hypothetical protein